MALTESDLALVAVLWSMAKEKNKHNSHAALTYFNRLYTESLFRFDRGTYYAMTQYQHHKAVYAHISLIESLLGPITQQAE